MSHWLEIVPAVAAGLVIVLLPGVAVGRALRLRGVVLWGFAPAAGVAAVSVSATLLGLLNVPWAGPSAALGVLLLVAIAAVIGRALRPVEERDAPRAGRWWIAVAVAAGAALGMLRMGMLIGAPGNISQTNDAIFHLNALRYIAETGHASSLDLLGTVGASGFYPAAWHSVASLVMQLSGTAPAVAANATSLVIAGPLWALSITSFVWCSTRGSRTATIAAAVLSPALFAFPFSMLDFGVLYPYALAVAVLPGVLALLARVSASDIDGRASVSAREIWLTVAATGVGIVALGLAQPSAVLIWLTGAVCIAVSAQLIGWGAASGAQRRRRLLVFVVVLLVGAVGWLAVTRLSSSLLWEPTMRIGAALAEMSVNGSVGPGPAIVMSLLSAVGFFFAARTARLRWLVLFSAAIVFLTAVALSVQNDTVRGLLAAWYADPHRFVSLMPLIVIPLAAVGVAEVSARITRMGVTRQRVVAAVLVTAVIAETVTWTLAPLEHRKNSYALSASSYLSIDEKALLTALPEYVGPDERVLGNPSTGAAFGYALSGRDVIPRTWSMPGDADFQELRWGLVDLVNDPEVCAVVDRMGIDYVLDFGKSAVGAGKWEMPGLTGFDSQPGFEKVAQVGAASLWLITGCD